MPGMPRTRRADVAKDRFYEDVGRCIRGFRIAAGLSQAQLARAVGIAQSQMGLVENSTTACSLYLASKIAEALDITIEDIAQVTIDHERESAE